MRELRVDIGGNTRGFQRATEEAVGIAKSGSMRIEEINKKQAMQYEDFWTAALERKEAKELALAESTAAEKLRIEKETAAEIAAFNAGVNAAGAGGGGLGGAGRTAQDVRDVNKLEKGAEIVGDVGMAAYAFDKAGKLMGKIGEDGKIIKSVASAEEGLAAAGHAAGGMSTIMRESMVIVREGLRGNFTRMVGSFTILIGAIGSVVAAALAVVGAADAVFELLGGNGIFRHVRDYMSAKGGEKDSAKSLAEANDAEREVLRKKVESLTRMGKISDKDSANLLRDLKSGTLENTLKVENVVNPLQKNGTVAEQEKQIENGRKLVEQSAERARLEAAYRQEQEAVAEPEQKRLMLMQDEKDLQNQILQAGIARDGNKMIQLQTDLLRKQAELKSADASQMHTHPASASHIDSLSSQGLFQSLSSTMSNPVLEVSKQQLTELRGIHAAVAKPKQDHYAP